MQCFPNFATLCVTNTGVPRENFRCAAKIEKTLEIVSVLNYFAKFAFVNVPRKVSDIFNVPRDKKGLGNTVLEA